MRRKQHYYGSKNGTRTMINGADNTGRRNRDSNCSTFAEGKEAEAT